MHGDRTNQATPSHDRRCSSAGGVSCARLGAAARRSRARRAMVTTAPGRYGCGGRSARRAGRRARLAITTATASTAAIACNVSRSLVCTDWTSAQPDAGQVEDLLDDDGAADQGADVERDRWSTATTPTRAGRGTHNTRVRRHALGPGEHDVVALQRGDHVRAQDPAPDRPEADTQGQRRQEEVAEVLPRVRPRGDVVDRSAGTARSGRTAGS